MYHCVCSPGRRGPLGLPRATRGDVASADPFHTPPSRTPILTSVYKHADYLVPHQDNRSSVKSHWRTSSRSACTLRGSRRPYP
jgi:hypothetical protein